MFAVLSHSVNKRPCSSMFSHLTSQGLFSTRTPLNAQTREPSSPPLLVCGGLVTQASLRPKLRFPGTPAMTQTWATPSLPQSHPGGWGGRLGQPPAPLALLGPTNLCR